MTQQPFYPQYPGQPQQGYPQQPQPVYPQQGYPPQVAPMPQQGFPAQGYPAQQVPAGPPAQPLAQGTLSDFYNQPSSGGGPSLSWTDKTTNQPKPIGTQYVGLVARNVTSADVQQQTDFQTKAPLTYPDGRPKFAMKVPLKLAPSQEFPDGEASWFVKGQAKDELQRAMSAAGVDGAPKEGAIISITLVQRRPSGRGMNPANIVQVTYTPGQGGAVATEAPSPVAVAQSAQAPAQMAPQMQPAQQYAPQQAPAQQYVPQQAPAPQAQQFAPQGVPQQVAQQVPAQQYAPQPPQGLAMPENMTEEQQKLFAQITGNQQAAVPQAVGQ